VVTIKEAAAVLGVSEVTLRRWDEAGKFKARRHPINGYRLYSRASVEQLRADIQGAR
jgi:excisionase family DNA binding protein